MIKRNTFGNRVAPIANVLMKPSIPLIVIALGFGTPGGASTLCKPRVEGQPKYLPSEMRPITPFSADPYHAANWWDENLYEFQVSDWDGPGDTNWGPSQVLENGCAIDIVLDISPELAEDGTQKYLSGEIKTNKNTLYGTYRWFAQAPKMQPGIVWGLFTYGADPWAEIDFEFVGRSDQVELNIHLIDEMGQHVTLMSAQPQKATIDLWFDASEAPHLYEVTLSETEVVFRIDGWEVGSFSAEDMPNNAWQWNEMQTFASLWAGADPDWAGYFTWNDQPLIGRVYSITSPD